MQFAPQLGASDVAGSGEDYHISSRRKGWTWLLVVPTLESLRVTSGPSRRFALCPLFTSTALSAEYSHALMRCQFCIASSTLAVSVCMLNFASLSPRTVQTWAKAAEIDRPVFLNVPE